MTVHPSLSSKGKGKRTRSVLKRYEKFQHLKEKEKWNNGDSIFGLPKIKTTRKKLKKAKKATEADKEQAAEGATPAAAGAGKEAPLKKKEETAKK
ncbi:small basic protein [Candidatus Omnitrophota bacterium]